ncbi:helix-turn-helix domain-containing protein [Streptomyces canus]|uniref:Transcriptional regulator with XRE-family HTH domain n=1 Tax=Streptomyces canus TaxID=58343 RepID=A0AAW8FD93_9ACTN|nr:helix-turn-helix transcriptional regulator [Streptomyces canus]MDQ0764754.1 transcriptional regulator with XRE-family HTH domain [Streptomyces canus]MDQ0906788.1 transcriptional regulator with XRE-family HTH domain [Streptomyces canus]MDQ1066806.1 transcriptional regulator with XRE-family HTH domain [Streptomyces canus]
MTRWRPLPDSLPREARHLVEQLRRLKDRTDLSLAELARRTAYSKSSWQRYLSGAKQPPRGAVEALCRVAGADQARLLALWDLASPVWPYGTVVAAAAPEVVPEGPAPAAPGLEYRRWRTAALAAFAVIVLLVAGVLWAWPSRGG